MSKKRVNKKRPNLQIEANIESESEMSAKLAHEWYQKPWCEINFRNYYRPLVSSNVKLV